VLFRSMIATRFGRVEAEEAYHAGLLCDIGKLVFDQALRNINLSFVDMKGISFDELETNYFGIDHASLGAMIAESWSLPPLLINAINFHHRPGASKDFLHVTSSVHLADVFVTMLGVGVGKDGLMYRIDPVALASLRFQEHEVEEMMNRVAVVIKEAEVLMSTISSHKKS
jgi:HD-like signal output (HDOD) protein